MNVKGKTQATPKRDSNNADPGNEGEGDGDAQDKVKNKSGFKAN